MVRFMTKHIIVNTFKVNLFIMSRLPISVVETLLFLTDSYHITFPRILSSPLLLSLANADTLLNKSKCVIVVGQTTRGQESWSGIEVYMSV